MTRAMQPGSVWAFAALLAARVTLNSVPSIVNAFEARFDCLVDLTSRVRRPITALKPPRRGSEGS
jgi:hypothetical protein